MGEASCPAPGPARSTPHLLPTGSPLQLTFSRSSSSSSTMSRRLFTARFDSFSCGKKTVCAHTNVGPRPHSAGRGGAGRGLGSHLGQLVILVVEGEGPELGAVPVLLLVRPRPAHLQRHHAASAPPPSRPVPSRQAQPLAAAHLPALLSHPWQRLGSGTAPREGRPPRGARRDRSPPARRLPPGPAPQSDCNSWRALRGLRVFAGGRGVAAGLGAAAGAGAAPGAAGPGWSARRNGETRPGGAGEAPEGTVPVPEAGRWRGPAVLAVSTGGRSGGGGSDGQVGGGRPALDRGAAGGRHQRQQLALVSGRDGRGAGRAGGGPGPGTGRHVGRCSLRTERDASNWSTERLKALLLPVRVEGEEGACEVTEVSKLDGEASINNRKGKLIFFYEWAIKLAWTGEWRRLLLFRGRFECEAVDAYRVLRCDTVRGCV